MSAPLFLSRRAAFLCWFAAGSLSLAASPAFGQSTPPVLTWGASGAGGAGNWDTSTLDWYNGTNNVAWTDGDSAVFGGTAGNVSITGSVTAAKVTFSTPGYAVQGFFLEGTSSGLTVQTDADATISSSIFGYYTNNTVFTKTGTGALTLTDQDGPVFFGSVMISAGELRFAGTGSPDFTTPYILGNTAGAALTFAASSTTIESLSGGGTLGGVVRPNVTSGSLSLSLNGGGSNATFGGTIQDNGGATFALQKNGNYTQTLTGANTYSGATTVSSGMLTLAGANGAASNTASVSVSGGTLLLDNSAAVNNQRLGSSTPINLSGGTLSLLGNATTNTNQTLGTLSFSRASTLNATAAGTAAAQLTFAGLTRQNNGTISFGGSGSIAVTGLSNLNGIVGGYATVGTDWASVDAKGNVVAYTGYSSDITSAGGQDNLRITSAGGTTALPRTQTHNSLNLVNSGSSAATLDLGAGQTLTLTGGGLLTSGAGGHVIQNGTLTTSGGELIVTNQAPLTIASLIANTSAAVTLTKSGAGTLALTGANTYTGPTVINQGTVRVSSDGNLGTGSVVNVAGGTLQAGASFTSAKSLQGSGTMDTAGFNVAFNGGNNGSINKTGAGTLALTGTVPFANVNGGVLRLTNLAANNAAFINLESGRLESSGTGVQGIVSFGNATELSPGAIGQAATLELNFFNVFNPTVVDFDLGSSGSDLLKVDSDLSLSGGFGQSLLFRFGNLGGTTTGTAYTLLNFPMFSGFGLNPADFGIDPASTAAGYKGTFNLSGNALTVTFTAVPEPGTVVWLVLGALCMAAATMRRRACEDR